MSCTRDLDQRFEAVVQDAESYFWLLVSAVLHGELDVAV